MVESLLPVLCDKWTHDPNKWCTIKFNTNGTGELQCRMEFQVFIAAEFDWKTQSDQNIEELSFPATIDIDMTLTKRNIKNANLMKGDVLEDAAFQTKTYQLRVEEGSFLVTGRTTYGVNPTYKYRLFFDKSPYPPLDEWKEQDAAEAYKFWIRNDFYQSQIEAKNAG